MLSPCGSLAAWQQIKIFNNFDRGIGVSKNNYSIVNLKEQKFHIVKGGDIYVRQRNVANGINQE